MHMCTNVRMKIVQLQNILLWRSLQSREATIAAKRSSTATNITARGDIKELKSDGNEGETKKGLERERNNAA